MTLVPYPAIAYQHLLRAIQRAICDSSKDYAERRAMMKLHDYVVEHGQAMTKKEFTSLMVAVGYCPTHLTERDGGRCVRCEFGQ